MENLTRSDVRKVMQSIAKELLEFRLGIEATDVNVQCLTTHLLQFEKEISQLNMA